MTFNLRKWIRVLHRDFGYLFAGMTLIYGISGIALNHLDDWNPNYIIEYNELQFPAPMDKSALDREHVISLLKGINRENSFKNYYFPSDESLKIFIKGGTIMINLTTGKGYVETIRHRPVFHEVDLLHYNPSRLWTWFSDLFAVALILLAVTGLFMIKGKKGITGRGAWLAAIGIAIPLIILYIYL
jgi:hypothetical protein